MNPMPRNVVRFRRMAFITLIAVYILIAVGASVRATGAGMGCPDWPKCFGMWIPPTDVSQLPADYQDIYAHRGYADTEFNAVKTWTEYLNRLMGASVGLLVVAMAASATIRLWSQARSAVVWSVAAVLLTGFAGWLGKVVVENNLSPVTITLHMATALLIVMSIVFAYARAGRDYYPPARDTALRWVPALLAACLVLSLVQIFMGTQVRQEVDHIADLLGVHNRAAWAAELPVLFYVHRTFSILILVLNAALAWRVWQSGSALLFRPVVIVLAAIAVEIISGAVMYYGAFPPALQPVHLICAAIMFGAQLHLAITTHYTRRNAIATARP